MEHTTASPSPYSQRIKLSIFYGKTLPPSVHSHYADPFCRGTTGTLCRSSGAVKVYRLLNPTNTKKLNLCTAKGPFHVQQWQGCQREPHLPNLTPYPHGAITNHPSGPFWKSLVLLTEAVGLRLPPSS